MQRNITIKTDDQLRNYICFEYLKNILIPIKKIPKEAQEKFPAIYFLAKKDRDSELDFTQVDKESGLVLGKKDSDFVTYNPATAYGNLYSEFLKQLDEDVTGILAQRDLLEKKLRDEKASTADLVKIKPQLVEQSLLEEVVFLVHANANPALEVTAELIQKTIAESAVPQTSSEFETVITTFLKTHYIKPINAITPIDEGTMWVRFGNFLKSDYKPQYRTSISTIRQYQYLTPDLPIEYRMGTQAQYHKKVARFSPTFNAWLRIQALRNKPAIQGQTDAKSADPKSVALPIITHVYINNLGLDPDFYSPDRYFETPLSSELHTLEQKHENVAVITMPADRGLMDKSKILDSQKKYSTPEIISKISNIVMGKSDETIKDFHMSERIKKMIFVNEAEDLKTLIELSLKKLGFNEKSLLSEADLQAVYFHFLKYEFTKFILEKLKPFSFNISCKDAIDRAGVASAYFNLVRSIELGKPMSEAEFMRALHAAPTYVKGRGMNFHTQILWNAVNAYIEGAALQKPVTVIPPWLVVWRNKNVLSALKEEATQTGGQKSPVSPLSPIGITLFGASSGAVIMVNETTPSTQSKNVHPQNFMKPTA